MRVAAWLLALAALTGPAAASAGGVLLFEVSIHGSTWPTPAQLDLARDHELTRAELECGGALGVLRLEAVGAHGARLAAQCGVGASSAGGTPHLPAGTYRGAYEFLGGGITRVAFYGVPR